MRGQVLGLAAVSFLFCGAADCCGTDIGVMARYGDGGDCYWLGCPIAVGSEARLYAQWSYDRSDKIVSASIDPHRATLELFHGDVLVRPGAPGSATLDVRLANGEVMSTALQFNVAVSIDVISPLVPPTYPPGLPQVFEGSSFLIRSEYRDLADQTLLGHGLERWSIDGGTLEPLPLEEPVYPPDDPYTLGDPDRYRRVRVADDRRRLVVRAHPYGAALEADIVAPGSTARLDLNWPNGTIYTPAEVDLAVGRTIRIPVAAYSADGRAIFGSPRRAGLRASVASNIASVDVAPDARALDLRADAVGTTELTVTFDGVTRRLRLNVY